MGTSWIGPLARRKAARKGKEGAPREKARKAGIEVEKGFELGRALVPGPSRITRKMWDLGVRGSSAAGWARGGGSRGSWGTGREESTNAFFHTVHREVQYAQFHLLKRFLWSFCFESKALVKLQGRLFLVVWLNLRYMRTTQGTHVHAGQAEHCRSCGSSYTQDSIFCRHCGSKRPVAGRQFEAARLQAF